MIGPPRRVGSMPIARKCARAGARSARSSSPVRARRRRAATGASVTPPTVLHVAGSKGMRIATVQMPDGARLAVEVDGDYRRLGFEGDLLSLVRAGVDPHELAVGDALAGELAAPLQPGKIVAIGLNYLDHIRESSLLQPAQPLVFAKFPSSVTGPGDPIVVDAELTVLVDWEVELGVVVGRRMRDIAVDAALDYVFGYTVCNDVSARDVQFSESQWTRGKSFDTFCPVGPVVVTADELPDPQALALRTRVNGEVMQDS